jgi:hypothetical protein
MKVRTIRSDAAPGYVLLVAMLITIIAIGLVLMAYLSLLEFQVRDNARTQTREEALAVAEAGIEEAMAYLYAHTAGGQTADDGWTYGADGTYGLVREVGDGFFWVTISNYVPGINLTNAVIESHGYVVASGALVAGASNPPALPFAVPDPSLDYLGRGVRVGAKVKGLFWRALAAAEFIGLENGVLIESDGASGLGRDQARLEVNGPEVLLVDATPFEKVAGYTTTRHGGQVRTEGSTDSYSLGSWDWVYVSERQGVDPSRFSDDADSDFGEAQLPPGAPVHIGHPSEVGYQLSSGYYQIDGFTLSPGEAIQVTGDVVLHCTGEIVLRDSGGITVGPNGRLRLYLGGAHNYLASGQRGWGWSPFGFDVIQNLTGEATNCMIFGLPSCQYIWLGHSLQFHGTVYAPQADVRMGYSVDGLIIRGAIVGRRIFIGGGTTFIYPEAFRHSGPLDGYVVSSWAELGSQDFASVVPRSE